MRAVGIQSGRFLGARFWKKDSPSTPVRVALQGRRPVPQGARDPVAHGQVVPGDVQLGEAALREVHLVRAGQPYLPVAHGQLHRLSHAATLCGRAAHRLPADGQIFRARREAPVRPQARQSALMDLPVMPPVKPMLAKLAWRRSRPVCSTRPSGTASGPSSSATATRSRSAAVRANRSPATFPSWSTALRGESARRAASWTARSSSSHDGRLDFDAAHRAHPPRRLAGAAARRGDPGQLRRLRPARARRRVAAGHPAQRAPRQTLSGALRRRSRPGLRRAGDAPTSRWRGSGSSEFEGAGLDGLVAKPLDLPYRPDAAADVQDQARAHRRLSSSRVSASTRAVPVVGSLLLGLYDDSGTLQHVGVCAVVHR